LGEECIHVASAFQVVGFAHVVATFWSVWDSCSAAVATEFYRGLLRSGSTDFGVLDLSGERVAAALDEAVMALARTGADLVEWVPYAHYGI